MRLLAPLLVVVGLAPVAQAATFCSQVTEQPPNALGTYVVLDPLRSGTEAWTESNGYPGLQRQPCVRDDTLALIGPDTQLLETMAAQ
ncbi:MAG TPA: hypothetical protein VNX21_02760 [Candidatus Thermoplasmatota archaeon]|nr:hypothetical protein [Candidatus Thermoplasmatota archaeon]